MNLLTIISHPVNGRLYGSPSLWRDANYAIRHNKAHDFVGITRKEAERYGVSLPQSAGEYVELASFIGPRWGE